MQRDIDKHPWDELDRYRGTIVAGEWPTLPELLRLSADKFGGKTAAAVTVSKRDGDRLFRFVLPDNVLIEFVYDLFGR